MGNRDVAVGARAVDSVGAGIGELVMLTSDGKFARDWLEAQATPVRWSVIGIEG